MSGKSGPELLSLIFDQGQRPTIAELREAGARAGMSGFSVTHAASDDRACWAELLASGLTFDCLGVAPGAAWTGPPQGALLGLKRAPPGEAIALSPGPHIADGAALRPVVRVLLTLACDLAKLPGVQAVCWHPATSWMEPKYFARIVEDWLEGGAFPALGLAVLNRQKSGALVSQGLGFFVGQELRLEPDRRVSAVAMAQLAVRLIDAMITLGPIIEPRDFVFEGSPPVLANPIEQGRILRVVQHQHAH